MENRTNIPWTHMSELP